MRLIDADVLMARLRKSAESNPGTIASALCELVCGDIELEPEAVIRCKDCRWGNEVCGNIECFADANVPPEYHGYEWFCPNGERRTDG